MLPTNSLPLCKTIDPPLVNPITKDPPATSSALTMVNGSQGPVDFSSKVNTHALVAISSQFGLPITTRTSKFGSGLFPPLSNNFVKSLKPLVPTSSSFVPRTFERQPNAAPDNPRPYQIRAPLRRASYAQAAAATRHYDINRSLIDDPTLTTMDLRFIKGKPMIVFKKEEIKALDERLKLVLILRFPLVKPSYNFIHNKMARLKLKGKYTLGPIGPRHVMLKLTTEEDYTRLWMKKDLRFLDLNGSIYKWTPEFDPDLDPPIAPVWIGFPNLNMRFCERNALMNIGSYFGKPLRLDEGAATMSRPDYPRICVEINLLDSLKEEIEWGIEDVHGQVDIVKQKVIYENLPSYCRKCQRMGHTLEECGVEKTQGTNEKVEDTQKPRTFVWQAKRNVAPIPTNDENEHLLSDEELRKDEEKDIEDRILREDNASPKQEKEKKIEEVVESEELEKDEQSSDEEETSQQENTIEREVIEDVEEEKKSDLEIKAEEIIHCLRTEEMTFERLHQIDDILDDYMERKPHPCWEPVGDELWKQISLFESSKIT